MELEPVMLPHCAKVKTFIIRGRCHFNVDRRLNRLSSRSWCLGDIVEKSGGQVFFALNGFAPWRNCDWAASVMQRKVERSML